MSSERHIALAVACILLCGCADFSRGGSPADGGAAAEAGAADGGTLSFAPTVHALLVGGCQGCHAEGKEAGGTPLLLTGDATADYAVTLPFVDVTTPAASRLLAKMSGSGHSGGAVYARTTPEYTTVLRWIEGGALP